MPYKSPAQAAYMHINHPDIAARWDKEYYGGSQPKPKRKKNVFDRALKLYNQGKRTGNAT